MSDCINSGKPASGAAKGFPKEQKNAFPCESGEGWEATSSGPSGHLPLSGEGFAWCCAISCAKRKVCPCEEARRADVAPSAPFRGTSPIGKGKALMGIFLSMSVLGSVHSISREMASVYLRKKSGPLSRNSSTDTPSSSSAWQAGSSRGKPKSPCIRRIR